jgi:hypothetical protein
MIVILISINDNCLLNVFTDYNYSNSLISRVCLTKVESCIKFYCKGTLTTIFFSIAVAAADIKIY